MNINRGAVAATPGEKCAFLKLFLYTYHIVRSAWDCVGNKVRLIY